MYLNAKPDDMMCIFVVLKLKYIVDIHLICTFTKLLDIYHSVCSFSKRHWQSIIPQPEINQLLLTILHSENIFL